MTAMMVFAAMSVEVVVETEKENNNIKTPIKK